MRVGAGGSQRGVKHAPKTHELYTRAAPRPRLRKTMKRMIATQNNISAPLIAVTANTEAEKRGHDSDDQKHDRTLEKCPSCGLPRTARSPTRVDDHDIPETCGYGFGSRGFKKIIEDRAPRTNAPLRASNAAHAPAGDDAGERRSLWDAGGALCAERREKRAAQRRPACRPI